MMDGFTCEAQYLYGNPIPNMKKHTHLFCLWKSARKTSGVSQDLSYHPAKAGDCPKAVMENGNFRELSTKKM